MSSPGRHLGATAGLLALAWVGGGAALAQDARVQGLTDRVDRLQRELITLQRQVYRGEAPPAAPAEAAPAPQSGDLTTTSAARIQLRLSQLEAQLRQLTGQIEEVSFRQTQLRGQIDKLAADTDLRLQRLEQGAGALGLAPEQPVAGAAPPPSDATPGVLGTIPAQDLEALQTERVEQASPAAPETGAAPEQTATAYAAPGGTAEEQYKNAFSLLSQADYGAAEAALRAFVEQYPDDPLAGNAKYWLGETYYVRQDYQQAAITFAEAYQRYPDNSKAPDNLLKLGMSLSSLGSKADACGTFAELLRRYPGAAVTVQQRAKQEHQRLGCK